MRREARRARAARPRDRRARSRGAPRCARRRGRFRRGNRVGPAVAGGPPAARSAVLPGRTVQPEEVALSTVAALLLVEEHEVPLLEHPEPLVPADLLETASPAAASLRTVAPLRAVPAAGSVSVGVVGLRERDAQRPRPPVVA